MAKESVKLGVAKATAVKLIAKSFQANAGVGALHSLIDQVDGKQTVQPEELESPAPRVELVITVQGPQTKIPAATEVMGRLLR